MRDGEVAAIGAAAIGAAADGYAALPLARRPGFLIRRLHQIHLACFAEECAGLDASPLLSSVLTVAGRQPGLEQSRLAEAVGVDRATLAEVVLRLDERGLVARESHARDRRLKLVRLTRRGEALLRRLAVPTARAHARTMAPLDEAERATFLSLLERLVSEAGETGPATAVSPRAASAGRR